MKTFLAQGLSLITFILCLVACSSNPKPTKSKASSEDAEKVVDRLHDLIAQHKYEETKVLFTEAFKKVTPDRKLYAYYDSCARFGDVRYQLVKNASVNAQPDGSVSFRLLCEAERSKVNSIEQYHMVLEENAVKINSFEILPDTSKP